MRLLPRPWIPCVLAALSSTAVACATASDASGVDASPGDAGGITIVNEGGSGPVIVTGGTDSGLPTITITSDGGRSSLNPTVDAGTTMPGMTGNAGSGDSAAPPGVDSSVPPADDSGTEPAADSGHHFHHDGGYHGSGSGSGSGTSGGGSSTSGGGGTVPTTCTEADGATGCCVGDTRYYCSAGAVATDDCTTNGKVCGWSATYSNYGCVDAPAKADPAGTYPLACGATGTGSGSGSASGSASGSGAIPTTCAQADRTVGCCGPNGTNYYCDTATSTTVESEACPADAPCGWGYDSDGQGLYGCVTGATMSTADPAGTYPIACQ